MRITNGHSDFDFFILNNLSIFKKNGFFQAEANSLRQISYPGIHVILLCFSVIRPDSFRSLKSYWLHELANAPILLNPVAQRTASRLFNQSNTNFPFRTSTASSSSSSNTLNTTTPSSYKSKSKINKLTSAKNHGLSTLSKSTKPGPVFLLVGCACDLRNDIGRLLELSRLDEQPVDRKKAEQLALELGAQAYIECSALTQKNLKTVFDLAIWFGLEVSDLGGPGHPQHILTSSSNFQKFSTVINSHPNSSSFNIIYNNHNIRPGVDGTYSNLNDQSNAKAINDDKDESLLIFNSRLSTSTPLPSNIIQPQTINHSSNDDKSILLRRRGWRRFLCLT